MIGMDSTSTGVGGQSQPRSAGGDRVVGAA